MEPRMKIRKGEVERRVKASVEAAGGTFIKINWKKDLVHFLTPKGTKKAEFLNFTFR